MDALNGVVTYLPCQPIIVQKRNCSAQYVERGRSTFCDRGSRPRADARLHKVWSLRGCLDRL